MTEQKNSEADASAFPNTTSIPAPESSEKQDRLLSRNFLLLWSGQTASALGTESHEIALMFFLKSLGNSIGVSGTIMMITSAFGVLFGPIGGTLADRFPRRKMIIWLNLISAVLVSLVMLVSIFGTSNTKLSIVLVAILSSLLAIVSSFFSPAFGAALNSVIPRSLIRKSMSFRMASTQTVGLVGQSMGGVFYTILGAPVLFLADAVSYLFAGGMASAARFDEVISDKPPLSLKKVFSELSKDMKEGFSFINSRKGLRNLFIVAAGLNFFVRPFFVLLPFYIEDYLLSSAVWGGFLVGGFGGGAVLGASLGGLSFWGNTRKRTLTFASALLMFGSCFVGLGFSRDAELALVLTILSGLCIGFVNVNIGALVQSATPGELQGRVFGFLGTLSSTLTPLAMGLTGAVAGLLPGRFQFIIASCGGAIIMLSLLLLSNRDFLKFLKQEKV